MKIVSFSFEQGNKYFGEIDNVRFFIGKRVTYRRNKGLMNIKGSSEHKYDRNIYRSDFGFWADFIHPTAMAEGGLYHTLNTYDRARFTFSFLQYAAHVPNGDFVLYLRELLKLPLAKEYFPDLILQNDRISQVKDNATVILENNSSTEPLMDYLNPSSNEVEDAEIIQAAKFIHWVQNDPAHRNLQVKIGVDHFAKKMLSYARRYNLNGIEDKICVVVADIRHQGRARSPEIITALKNSTPLESLLKIGRRRYPNRINTLENEINLLTKEGILGNQVYSVEKESFIKK